MIQRTLNIGLCLFICGLWACNQPQQRSDAPENKELQAADAMKDFPSDSLRITAPDSGEVLTRGTPFEIQWTGGPDTLTVFLIDSALQTQGASVSISDRIYGIPNSGKLEYTPPQRLNPGTYKLTIGSSSTSYFQVK